MGAQSKKAKPEGPKKRKASVPAKPKTEKPTKRPKGRQDNRRSRSWDGTHSKPSDEVTAFFKRLSLKYLEYSLETGESGYKHGQFRMIFYCPMRFASVQKLLGPDVHLEETICTQDDNYTRKWGSEVIISYDNRNQGKRCIFKDQAQLIKDGATIRECIDLPGANAQSVRSAEILMAYIEPPRPVAAIEVLYSETNQLEAIYSREGSNLYRPPVTGQRLDFWTGYDAHASVVIDCALHQVCPKTLRQWISPCPFLINTKGGARQARYTRIYVIRPPEAFGGVKSEQPRLPTH